MTPTQDLIARLRLPNPWHEPNNAADTMAEAAAALEAKDAEIARLTAALEDAEKTMALCEPPPHRDRVHQESVDALGRCMGYGALMAAAQYGWRKSLERDGYPSGGEFVAGPCYGTVIATLKRARAALRTEGGE